MAVQKQTNKKTFNKHNKQTTTLLKVTEAIHENDGTYIWPSNIQTNKQHHFKNATNKKTTFGDLV